MKTILLTLSTLLCLSHTYPQKDRPRRGSFSSLNSYSLSGSSNLNLYEPLNIPLQETQLYSLGIDQFLPIPQGNTFFGNKANIAPVAVSNSIEKPVQETPDPTPQQPTGTAVIPFQPPPAVPVNAAASNVPGNNGAVFLGSGSLGVINLGNGAFALGSGGIGYSDMRQQPRPNGRSPLYPPLPATPNLVPAATPSQQPIQLPQPNFVSLQSSNGYQFSQPLFNPYEPQKTVDQNGYERLDPTSAGFGSLTPRIRPLKTRNSYATPTVQQVNLQAGDPSQLPQPGFGDPIPRLPAVALKYY